MKWTKTSHFITPAFYGLGRSGLKVSYTSKKRTIFDKADRVTETCEVLIV
jgi:hypothetical protein